MGVHGLWKLLESTGKPINPETLEGKILAVDISIWLNQAVKGANRRQRKEEMSVASRQTNEKLLKTFLKRQAIRAAMGVKSHCQAYPLLEEKKWMIFTCYLPWKKMSKEEFAQLPAEMKHEILRDMKEFSKRRRTMFQKPPEKSKEFSQYQLAGLLNRNKLNQRMEGVEREMAQRGLGVLQEENRGRTVEARSLVSEDTAHYVLIKGSKSEEKTSEKEVTSVPWTSCDWVGRQKPEPLWHPLSEKSPEKKPSSLSKNPIAQDVAPSSSLPPSPRTLKAIQAAMNSSSDEESHVSSPVAVRSQQPNEQLSPRTLLAIQRALTEEEADPCTPVYQSSTRVTPLQRSPIQQLTDSVNSSEREMDDSTEKKDVRSGSLLDSKELSVNCANFIDVSDLEEEESEEEGKEEEPVPEEVSTKEMRSEGGSLAEPPSHGPPQLDGADEEKERIQSSQETLADAADKQWEHMDVEELLQLESTLQSEQSTLEAQKQQQERMATTITGQMYLESQELLRLFGVPYFVAPMEAEAQCAVLERLDQTHGTITDDSDIWLFGGRHVYKNFFTHNKYVELYQYLDIQNQLGLDQSKLINLAYLLGSDYTEGVPGVGYVTGMEILNEFPGLGLEPLTNFSKWWSEAQENKKLAPNPNDTKVKKKLRKILLPPGFPNPVVAQAYLHPTVDDSCTSFSWGQPHMELIKEYPFPFNPSFLHNYLTFCLSRFGWSSRRTEEVLQPVMKQLNMHQKQLRIDSFFRLEQQERQVIRSQRLRRAVTCLKRKEEEEENSMEEGACSPVKAKNMKSTETKAEGSATWGGGFLASQDVIPNFGGDEERTTEGSETLHTPPEAKSKLSPIKAGRSSSSSEGDSDTDIGVAMVTARSVFENKPRGRGRRRLRCPTLVPKDHSVCRFSLYLNT
ncbi:DNA repair protein complementing XP-G cells-like [Scleropages formosus]|uniref:DNA repair protein complementing XP-G cells-like n=1 Tax=Scleropages formosus TaxID=113540 RepID=A0A0N8JY62_SCLFO|nr:DNA repair protein complementing XP-G cells-like [Scleropages formosus]